jgi:bifunctional DNase/RNase
MSKKQVNIFGISNSHSQSGAFALILNELGSNKRIPIIIGAFEAQAIALSLEGMKPSRPLTHDLFKNFASKFKIKLKEVFINKFNEGVFYALLICENEDGEIFEIDSRTSDAVALAVRFGCPIFADDEVIEKTAIIMEDKSDDDDESDDIEGESETESGAEKTISDYSIEELEKILENAIATENFEYAAKIHAEIKKRKEK